MQPETRKIVHILSGVLLALAIWFWAVHIFHLIRGYRVSGLRGLAAAVSLDAIRLAPGLAGSVSPMWVCGIAAALTLLYALIFYLTRARGQHQASP